MRHSRRRYRSRRHRRQNTVWQPFKITHTKANIPQGYSSSYIGTLYPGVLNRAGTLDPFEDQHTLQRIRGQIFHQASSTNTTYGEVMPVNVAMFKVPAAVGASGLTDADMPNLFQSGSGEDFPFYMACLCGDSVETRTEVVDNRAKRRMDPGDSFVFSASYDSSGQGTQVDITISINFRLLWSLLK